MRKVFVAVLAAAVVGIPAMPSYATIDKCPAGVSEVRGTNPSWAQVSTWIEASAAAHDVPAAILKAIALRESEWQQFLPDGSVKVSTDAVCGLGIMQVTADDREDAVKLAEDPRYNVDEGAKILRAKWEVSQTTPPPTGAAPDDDEILENWYYAICLYNGCGSDDTYARIVAGMVADPFRRVPFHLWKWMRPAGFTMPHEADPAYEFPNAFQARHSAGNGTFVFYDHTTGTVTKTVSALTHLESAPPVVAYPKRATGPDMLGDGWRDTTCGVCGGWRLAEGQGVSGRAHWTNTVTTAPQSSVTWRNHEPGRFRVTAYVPSLGDAMTLGTATYRIRPTSDDTKHFALPAVDQNAKKGTWVPLGDWTMDGNAKVYINDGSSVAGHPIVADAVRFTPIPVLTIDTYVTAGAGYQYGVGTVDYGQAHAVSVRFSFPGQVDEPVAGRTIKIYRRVAGTPEWQMLGAWPTNELGGVDISTRPYANMEYTARYTSPDKGAVTDAASRNLRVNVRTLVRAGLARTSIRSGDVVTVNTSVAPSHAGQVVYLQRFYSGAWRTIASRTLSPTSTATFSFRFAQPCCATNAKHLFRVYKPADRDHVLGLSKPMTLYVTS